MNNKKGLAKEKQLECHFCSFQTQITYRQTFRLHLDDHFSFHSTMIMSINVEDKVFVHVVPMDMAYQFLI